MPDIGSENLSISEFESVIFDKAPVNITEDQHQTIEASYAFLQKYAENKIIYGVNTGLGPMAQYRVDHSEQLALQYNLIRSHASGMGTALDDLHVRAAMLARLLSLAKGQSGIHTSVVLTLKELIDQEIYPLIYEHGGVGASGDLVQLAHMALALIGEGQCRHNDQIESTEKLLAQKSIEPIKIHLREGLAIMNGTSVMTGIGLVNLMKAKRLLHLAVLGGAIINEIVQSFGGSYSEPLNKVKLHNGQRKIAAKLTDILADSQCILNRNGSYFDQSNNETVLRKKVQEYYSLRCLPQILGPITDTISYAETVLVNELNSVSDNPIIDYENEMVHHGGNFHGDYVSLEMDKLKIAVTKLSVLLERQLNFLLNHQLNEVLPPFINAGKLGLNLGMQGAQYTATSTTAESKMMANPMYVQNIPSNNDNQDVVSMGTNAALAASRVIDNTYDVITVQLCAITQAVYLLKIEDKLSTRTAQLVRELKPVVPEIKQDVQLSGILHEIRKYAIGPYQYFNKQ